MLRSAAPALRKPGHGLRWLRWLQREQTTDAANRGTTSLSHLHQNKPQLTGTAEPSVYLERGLRATPQPGGVIGRLPERLSWSYSIPSTAAASTKPTDVEASRDESKLDSSSAPPPPPPPSPVPFWRQLKIRWHLLQLERIWPPPTFALDEFLQGAQFAFRKVCEALAENNIESLGDAVGDQVARALRDTLDAYEREHMQVTMLIEQIAGAQVVNTQGRYDFDRRLFVDIDVELVACFSTTWRRLDGSLLNRELHTWRKPVWRFETLLAERLDPPSTGPLGLTIPHMRVAPEPEWQLVHILN
jgi:hypothetical protein